MADKQRTASTVANFCNRYHIHPATYYRNAKAGRMPPAIKIGSATRILAEDEIAWLEASRSGAAGHSIKFSPPKETGLVEQGGGQ